jgi:1,4-dihydroxy-2-naphthoate octaprenyltransferase
MKKTLFALSILLIIVWVIGFFLLKMSSVVHVLIFLSFFIYIRSLLYNNNSTMQAYYGTGNKGK